jgi:hypothetical protein
MIEVLKQMVEALEWSEGLGYELQGHKEAIQAGLKAIAELESQEPFCYAYKENGEDFFAPKDGYYPADAKPLYTHPPQRTWVGLTDEEINEWTPEIHGVIQDIEAKLKERNG